MKKLIISCASCGLKVYEYEGADVNSKERCFEGGVGNCASCGYGIKLEERDVEAGPQYFLTDPGGLEWNVTRCPVTSGPSSPRSRNKITLVAAGVAVVILFFLLF